MGTRCIRLRPLSAAALAILGLTAAACHSPAAGGASAAPAALHGRVAVDGSSTVLPVSRAMAAAFRAAHEAVDVSVEESGTGGGFRKFCAGDVDIADASRPINAAEIEACRANRIDFVELPIAFDALSVVVNPRNDAVACLTLTELKTMWEPAAEGRVTRWSAVRATLPAEPLPLFGPGRDSGTFDYFTLAVVGTQSSSRHDYTASEDDEELANGVAADPNALGYFGYAYYLEHQDRLKAVAVDAGKGCILPSPETVADGTYTPLSRPIFVYASVPALQRPEVRAFAQFYVDPINAAQIQQIGYVPLPPATLLAVGRRLDKTMTGSVFGGRGSVLGLTAEVFQDEDAIRNALVR